MQLHGAHNSSLAPLFKRIDDANTGHGFTRIHVLGEQHAAIVVLHKHCVAVYRVKDGEVHTLTILPTAQKRENYPPYKGVISILESDGYPVFKLLIKVKLRAAVLGGQLCRATAAQWRQRVDNK